MYYIIKLYLEFFINNLENIYMYVFYILIILKYIIYFMKNYLRYNCILCFKCIYYCI